MLLNTCKAWKQVEACVVHLCGLEAPAMWGTWRQWLEYRIESNRIRIMSRLIVYDRRSWCEMTHSRFSWVKLILYLSVLQMQEHDTWLNNNCMVVYLSCCSRLFLCNATRVCKIGVVHYTWTNTTYDYELSWVHLSAYSLTHSLTLRCSAVQCSACVLGGTAVKVQL